MALKNQILQQIVDDLKNRLPKGEKQEFFERIMVGGLKIMAGDGDYALVDQRLQQGGNPVTAIGQGVVELLGLMFERSRRTMPWDVGTIAGYALVAEVLDYAEGRGLIQVTPEVIGQAMQAYAETLLNKMGVDQGKLQEMVGQANEAATQDPRIQAEYGKQYAGADTPAALDTSGGA